MAEKLGEIDIDTLKAQYSIEMVNRKIERMQKAVSGADKQMNAWQKTWNTLGRVAGAFGVYLGVASIINYIASLKNLGEELNRARGGFVAGSKAREDFEKQTGGFGDARASEINKLSTAWDNFWLGFKVKTAQGISDFAKAWKQGRVTLFGITPESGKAPTLPDLEDKPVADASRDLLDIEDQLAQLQVDQTASLDDQLRIIEKQLELERQKAAVAIRTSDPNSRRVINDTMASIGALKMRSKELQRQRDIQNAGAQAELTAMEQIRDGQSQAAKLTQLRAKYAAQISQAEKEGNTALVNTLKQMKAIEELEAKRSAHRMTPRERVNERREARKRAREGRQAEAAENRFARKWSHGDRPATPGSEFGNWAKREGLLGSAGRKGAQGSKQPLSSEQISTMLSNIQSIANALSMDQ